MKNKVVSMLLSVAIALGLWAYVITTVSPGSKDTISGIPVVFEGETALKEKGLMITSENNVTVSLELSGNRSDLAKLDKNNITVKVDLTKVYDPGEQCSFNVPQECMAKTNTLMCTLNNTRNIRHNKAFSSVNTNYPKIWNKGCKVIVCNLWTRFTDH